MPKAKQLTVAQIKTRFEGIFSTFSVKELDDPIIAKSILEALENLRLELLKVISSKPLTCEECRKVKNSTKLRACGYYTSVYNDHHHIELICDTCEHEHLKDI